MRAFLILLVLVSVSVQAQTRPPDSLTVYDALALVAGDHPFVRSAQALAASREAAVHGVTSRTAPTFTYAMEGIGQNGGFTEQRVGAGIEVGPSSLARAERRRLGAEARAFASDAEATRRLLRARVVSAYIDLAVADSLVGLRQEGVDLADGLAEVARLREAAGEAAGLETLRAELEAEQARADLAVASSRREAARAGVLAALGLPLEAVVPVAPSLDVSRAVGEPFTAPRDTLPAIRAAQSRVDAAGFAADAARAARLPVWSAEVFPQHFGGTAIGAGFQVGVRLPLGQGRIVAARVEAAEAERRAAEADREALALMQSAGVQSARARVEAARNALAATTRGPVEQADVLLDLTLRGYQLGEVTQQVVLDTRRSVLATRQAALNALADLFLALAEWERASGTQVLFLETP